MSVSLSGNVTEMDILSLKPVEQDSWVTSLSRSAALLALGICIFALIIYPVQALRWASRPFLGGLMTPTLVIDLEPVNFSTPWDGTDAGFDRLTGIMGNTLDEDAGAARLFIEAFIESSGVGRRVPLNVERYAESRSDHPSNFSCLVFGNVEFPAWITCTVVTTVRYITLGELLNWFGVPYVIGLLYLIAGIVVFTLRRDDPRTWTFAIFLSSAAISIAGLFDNYSTYTLTPLWTVALAFCGSTLMLLALTYPYDLPAMRRRKWLRVVVYIPAIALSATSLLLLYGGGTLGYYWAWLAELVWLAATFAAFIISLYYKRRISISPIVREKTSIILLGSVPMLLPVTIWSLNVLIDLFIGTRSLAVSMSAVFPFFAFFPIAIVASHMHHKLSNVEKFITRAAVYFLLSLGLILGYALFIGGVSFFIGDVVDTNTPALMALFVIAISLFFLPLRDRLQQVVDDVYYRKRRDYAQRLDYFNQQMAEDPELDNVISTIKEMIRDALQPTSVFVFLYDVEQRHYADYDVPPQTEVRFMPEDGTAKLLEEVDSALYLEFNQDFPPALIGDRARLSVLNTPILIGLHGRKSLTGFIAIGHRKTGIRYAYEDLRFIENLADQSALAVERAQVVRDLKQRVLELNVLSSVSQAVNFNIEFDDLLELIYAQASRVIDAQNFFIIMHDQDAKELYYAFYVGERTGDRIREREGERWRMGNDLASEVIKTGQPIQIDDYAGVCARRGVEPRDGAALRNWMGVPLNAPNRTLGALVVADSRGGAGYTDEQLKVFWSIADQAAMALYNSSLFRETRRHAGQLAVLNEISSRLSSTLDLEDLLPLITENAIRILDAEAGSLLLIDRETGDLEFRVAIGPNSQDLIGTRLPAGTGIVGNVADRGDHMIVNDTQSDPRWFSGVDQASKFVTRALLAVPLIYQTQVIGVLELVNKKSGGVYTEEDASLLTTFAAQAAIAIQNARLFASTDQQLAKRVNELSVLQRIDRELNSTLEIDRIIELTLDWTMRISGASHGVIGMIRHDPRIGVEFVGSYGYGDSLIYDSENLYPIDQGAIGGVIQTGEPLLVNGTGQNAQDTGLMRDVVAQLIVPLRSAGEVAGIICLESNIAGVFSEEDFDLIVRVADHASSAILNAQLYKELQIANSNTNTFMGFVAHELKNPMTAIRGYADFMYKGVVGEINDQQSNFLKTIISNTERMQMLVEDLRDSAQLQANQMSLNCEAVPIGDLIQETLDTRQQQIEERGQRVVLNVPDDLPPVWADPQRIVQVLLNFISNANKYTPDGGTITIEADIAQNIWDTDTDAVSHVIHVSVADTGIGMSDEDQNKLFTPYFRSESQETREQPGTGLGLSLTKDLIELHGGLVWFESELGVGSVFHFTLPLASEVAPVEAVTDD
jgi:signal transduction histidine kinase